jgi:hypothetical protein
MRVRVPVVETVSGHAAVRCGDTNSSHNAQAVPPVQAMVPYASMGQEFVAPLRIPVNYFQPEAMDCDPDPDLSRDAQVNGASRRHTCAIP